MATVNGDAVALFITELCMQLLRMGMTEEETLGAITSLLKSSGIFQGPHGDENRQAVISGIRMVRVKALHIKEEPENV